MTNLRNPGGIPEIFPPGRVADPPSRVLRLPQSRGSLGLWRLFWAKTLPAHDETRAEATSTHPLWAHLLDVASVATVLWGDYLSADLRHKLTAATGLSEEAAGHLYSLILGLHDVGKAIPCFQTLHAPSRRYLNTVGLRVLPEYDQSSRLHHGHASIPLLHRWIEKRLETGELSAEAASLLQMLSAVVGFHHGVFFQKRQWEQLTTRYHGNPCGGDDRIWDNAQQGLINAVVNAWELPSLDNVHPPDDEWPSWLLGFLGWSTTSDWLGSMTEIMPRGVGRWSDLKSYLDRQSRVAARTAVVRSGFALRAALKVEGGFLRMFGAKIKEPRRIQTVVATMELAAVSVPTLTIIEAPTGEGKSEAAFYLAARQQEPNAPGGGIYLALPTQATSDAQLVRFRDDFLANAHVAYRDNRINLRLVHGNDDLHEGQQQMLADGRQWADSVVSEAPNEQGGDDSTIADERAITASWFMPRKRSLLAPYGVGTVDQALLSVLNARHSYLRLFGLSGKTVIFDEIHAYDAYMDLLFEHALRWLQAMGTHVILLSATLPSAKRTKFLKAWGATDIDSHGSVRYPAIWTVGNGACTIRHGDELQPTWKQEATVLWIDNDLMLAAMLIREAAASGATVGVILNTVDRAQRVYRALRCLGGDWETLILFHARYEHKNRRHIEARVLENFGPDMDRVAHRPRVLIATQVAEQSLDLDFDVLFTDIAPIDLLLQRAGRLHRHFYRPWQRPDRYINPTLHILCPANEEGELPRINDIASIYDKIIIWKTWRMLKYGVDESSSVAAETLTETAWNLPRDYRPFIEQVYDEATMECPWWNLSAKDKELWEKAFENRQASYREARRIAQLQCIPSPDNLESLVIHNDLLRVEDDDAAIYMKALTRLGESVEVVCLHLGADERLYFDLQCTGAVDLDHLLVSRRLERSDWEPFLQNSLRLSMKHLPRVLATQKDSPDGHPHCDLIRSWNRVADRTGALRYRRLLIFEGGIWRHPAYRSSLIYDEELGLVTQRQGRDEHDVI